MMLTTILIEQFNKDLGKLREEMAAYTDEASIWKTAGATPNCGGNLCLHLCGNLQHFIGNVLGESGYVRNRDAEFSLKNVQRQKLLDEIDATRTVVVDTLEQVSKNELQSEYPVKIFEEPMTTEYFLLYLLTHLNYHLGQISYHRRFFADNAEAK